MRLSDFVRANQVVVPLRHDTVTGAADDLIERLTAAGGVSDGDKLRTRVAEERPEDIVGATETAGWGGAVHSIPLLHGHSTTSLLAKIRKR